LLFYSIVHSSIGSIASRKGDETMHRETLNQEIVNACNFMIMPIVMAIVLFLVVQPYSGTSSFSTGVGQVFACLICP
jgi:hypothetical protein